MIGVVIVAHGDLALEYKAAIEHVVGPQGAMMAISISPECDRSRKQAEICAAADLVDSGAGVVIVTDMFGGSPSNLSIKACDKKQRKIVYGANLPMLIKLTKLRQKDIEVAVNSALVAGRKYMDSYTL